MSFLIIGVLVVIAILALLGIVWVLRSDKSSVQPLVDKATPIQDVPAPTPQPQITSMENGENTAVPYEAAEAVALSAQPFSLAQDRALSIDENAESTVSTEEFSNGQFNELSGEAHKLLKYVQELEHRLSLIVETVDRVKPMQ